MCTGRYDEDGAPVVDCYVSVVYRDTDGALNFKRRLHSVEFLVDTGADATVLSMATANAVGIPNSALVKCGSATGVGTADVYEFQPAEGEIAIVADERDADGPEAFHIETKRRLQVIPNLPTNLLGRDLVNQFDVTLSFRDDDVVLRRHGDGPDDYVAVREDDDRLGDVTEML